MLIWETAISSYKVALKCILQKLAKQKKLVKFFVERNKQERSEWNIIKLCYDNQKSKYPMFYLNRVAVFVKIFLKFSKPIRQKNWKLVNVTQTSTENRNNVF